VKNCGRLSCPAHGSFNPYCWSIVGAGDGIETMSEDDRRRRCIACPNFKAQGVFWMDRVVSRAPITSDNITTLSTIINQAGIIIENFRIFNALEVAHAEVQEANQKLKVVNEDLRQAQARINRDLDHARTIQQGLLPHIDAKLVKGFEVGSKYIPADAVGGDYYDVFAISPGVYGIVVADVSGHGVSSALIMSMVKVLLKTFAAEVTSPQATLEQINQTFQTEIRTDNFVTIFYAVLDTNQHALRYTSAGHCPTLFLNRKTGACRQVKADGLFLGAFADMMLEESCVAYEPGTERIVLYTDGLTEAKNGNEDMFDLSRLEKAATDTLGLPPDKAIKEIMRKQKEFCGENGMHEDDITLLVIDI
jgi:sigma-B regulation protein RsbU (phosphoserine phosphatase)